MTPGAGLASANLACLHAVPLIELSGRPGHDLARSRRNPDIQEPGQR